MKHITLEQARQLKIGTTLYQPSATNADGSPVRWRVTGKVKNWKRHPEMILVPIKYGLKLHSHLNANNLVELSLTPYWSKRFAFGSVAAAFQRKKRKEGFRTQMEVHAGLGEPYTLVMWEEKPKIHFKINPEADEIADDDLIAAANYYDELK